MRISNDLLQPIVGFSTVGDLISWAQVNRKMSSAPFMETFWRREFLRRDPKTKTQTRDLAMGSKTPPALEVARVTDLHVLPDLKRLSAVLNSWRTRFILFVALDRTRAYSDLILDHLCRSCPLWTTPKQRIDCVLYIQHLMMAVDTHPDAMYSHDTALWRLPTFWMTEPLYLEESTFLSQWGPQFVRGFDPMLTHKTYVHNVLVAHGGLDTDWFPDTLNKVLEEDFKFGLSATSDAISYGMREYKTSNTASMLDIASQKDADTVDPSQKAMGPAFKPQMKLSDILPQLSKEQQETFNAKVLSTYIQLGFLHSRVESKFRTRFDPILQCCIQHLGKHAIGSVPWCEAAICLIAFRPMNAQTNQFEPGAWEPPSFETILKQDFWKVPSKFAPIGSLQRKTMLVLRPPVLHIPLSDLRWAVEAKWLAAPRDVERLEVSAIELIRTVLAMLNAIQLEISVISKNTICWHILHNDLPGSCSLTGYSHFNRFFIRLRDVGGTIRKEVETKHARTEKERKDRKTTDFDKILSNLPVPASPKFIYALVLDVSNLGPIVCLRERKAVILQDAYNINSVDWGDKSWANRPTSQDEDNDLLPLEEDARQVVHAALRKLSTTTTVAILPEQILDQDIENFQHCPYKDSLGAEAMKIGDGLFFESSYGDHVFRRLA